MKLCIENQKVMKKIFRLFLLGLMPSMMMAQSAIDANQLAQGDLKGTSRFVSMGGAFTALGGDLSSMNQNPAGVGVYRSSEVGLTFEVSMQSTESNSMGYSLSENQTKLYCPNLAYIGSLNLDSEVMPYFNWGVSYSRLTSFDRLYSGGMPNIATSMSNYIADFTNKGGYSPSKLQMTNDYNPYWESNADWLSILAYNSYMIAPSPKNNGTYDGMFKEGTVGDAMFSVREKGYVDEFSLNVGGNFVNKLYWGVGLGITDIDYTNQTYYDENLEDALITETNDHKQTTTGNAKYGIANYKHINGTGFNLKAGLIYKPIDQLRIGVAVHTPTYYDLHHEFYADSWYDYSSKVGRKHDWTDGGMFDSKMQSPWRFMAGIATVIGSRGIVSFDYERVAYNDMKMKDEMGRSLASTNGDIKDYYKDQNIFKIGGEFRVTPKFSVRAGYNYQFSNVKNSATSNKTYIFTQGTDPSYLFDDKTQYITCGLGYRAENGLYVDGAFVYKNRKSEFHAFSNIDDVVAPNATIKDNNSSIVVSVGYKF